MFPYADTLGNIYVPMRAEGPDNTIGDGFVRLDSLSGELREAWEAWLLENPIDVIDTEE